MARSTRTTPISRSAAERIDPIIRQPQEHATMSKGLDKKKEAKKEPAKSLKEKRAEKKAKKVK
jgi:hypothetical protein